MVELGEGVFSRDDLSFCWFVGKIGGSSLGGGRGLFCFVFFSFGGREGGIW